MKKLIRLGVLLTFSMTMIMGISAQTNPSTEREQGYSTIGINGGVAYQQSDVLTDLSGLSVGFIYGKNLIYSPNAPFSVDWRSRFQIARSFGKDIRPSLGIEKNEALNGERSLDYTAENGGLVYANHKTNLVEVGLEGVITLNGLRQKTGVGLSFTGGIGLDWYKTTIDQRDANGLYSEPYKNIDAGGARPFNLSQLDAFQDGKYETIADGFTGIGKFGVMPSLGIELDYDLTSNLALGIGHRVTFSGTDLLDGQQWTNNNALTGNNDILHYTSLGLKYTFNKNKKQKSTNSPTIGLIEPYGNDLKTNKSTIFIKAKVNNVNNPFDVYLTVNGEEQRFNFNNQVLTAKVKLQQGKNQITISANNHSGSDRETFILFFEPTEQAPILSEIEDFGTPDISFTNPTYDGIKVEREQFKVRAKVRHIDSRKSIEFRVNGRKTRFEFDPGIAALDAIIDLQKGKNIIEIRAKNKSGERQLNTTVFYQPPLPYPTLRFIRPTTSNTTVEREKIAIEVDLKNISQSSDIQLILNKISESNFYFDNRTGRLKANILLREGRNEIEVIARNKKGEATEQINVVYQQPYVPIIRSPRVTINAPKYQQSTTSEEVVTIHATLTHTFSKSDIRFTNNGQPIYDFQFNPNTGILTHNLYLRAGINQVIIEAQNEAGRDGASATIDFEVPLPPRVIIAPYVEIIRPRNREIFEDREIKIKASLKGIVHKNDIEFRVNREDCIDFRFNPTNGKFSATVKLRKGENSIQIKGANPAGVDREKVIVFYEQAIAPIIDIRQPDYNSTEKEYITLKADMEYIKNKRDIRLVLNNRSIRDFQFRDKRLEAILQLQEGSNDIEIIAENKYGETSKRLEVTYYIPKSPSISILEPSDNQLVKAEHIQLEAVIENINDKKDIRLFINGRASGNFEWRNQKLTATIHLKEGINTILIKTKTENGQDEANLQINYQPIKPPEINFVSHNNKEEVEAENIVLKAYLKNVKNKEEITFKVNGQNNTDFTFKEGVLKSSIQLEKGENAIELKVKTEDGKAEKYLIINYKPRVNPPVVRFDGINKFTQHTFLEITAFIENISSKKALQLSVNGKAIADFQFDIKSRKLTAMVFLKKGLNIIKVQAENEGGIVEKDIKITRRLGRPTISKGGKIAKPGKKKRKKSDF